jgi:hypothetical protein
MNAQKRRRKNATVRLVVVTLTGVLAGFASAQSALPREADTAPVPSTALIGNVDFAVDADGVHVSSVRLGGTHACGAYLADLGFAAAQARDTRFRAFRDATGFTTLPAMSPSTSKAIRAEAGFVQLAGRTRIVGDATWHARPFGATAIDLVGAADVVGTQPAVDRGIAYGFVGAAAEHRLLDGITARGLAGVQSFTDGNERMHMRARLTWQALPAFGIDAQLRWRQYESRDDAVDAAYFNPDRYAQWQGMLDMRRRIGGFDVTGALGAGVETVDGIERRPVRTVELRAEGAVVEKLRLAVYARYNRSADDADVADFSSRQAGVTFSYPF